MKDQKIELPEFPAMLRKMWSGGEVQQWIDENIAPLFETDRQRRGEPVAYGIKAANTGEIVTVLYGSDVDQVGEYRADLVVPLYTTPQPAQPDALAACHAVLPFLDSIICYASSIDEHAGNRAAKMVQDVCAADAAPQPAEPVKVPLGGDILQVWAEEVEEFPLTRAESSRLIRFARALLARYGGGTL